MTAPRPSNVSGAFLALLAFALFSVHDVIVKDLGQRYTPFQIIFFTALMSFPVITLVMIRDPKPGTLRPIHPWWIALRSLAGAASGICVFFALAVLPLTQVYAFIFMAPLLITLLAIPILGEKVGLRRGLAVLVGLGGVLVVLQPGAAPLAAGHIAAIGAAVFSALASIIVRKIGREERGVVMILYPMMTNLILCAIALPFVYVDVPLRDLGLFAVDMLLVLGAMSLLVAAYGRATATVVAPMQYSQIIWATGFGILLFGEYPEVHVYAGTAIIAASGLYILAREARVSKTTPVLRTRSRGGHALGLRVSNILRK